MWRRFKIILLHALSSNVALMLLRYNGDIKIDCLNGLKNRREKMKNAFVTDILAFAVLVVAMVGTIALS